LTLSIASRVRIYAQSVVGNTHVHRNIPNQDSHAVFIDDVNDGQWIVAIADGHGSNIHHLSNIGSSLAVQACLQEIQKFKSKIIGSNLVTDNYSIDDIKDQLAPLIVERWRALAEHDFNERRFQGLSDDPGNIPLHVFYGTTLAFAFRFNSDIILGSIGDTDGFWRSTSGLNRHHSLLGESIIDVGEETYSMCQKNATNYFKFNSIPASISGTMILATDGVKKSLSGEHAIDQLLDYYHHMCESDPESISGDLQAQLTALTTEGSGDDCTAIIIHLPEDPSHKEEITTSDKVKGETTYFHSSGDENKGIDLHDQQTATSKKKSPLLPDQLILVLVISIVNMVTVLTLNHMGPDFKRVAQDIAKLPASLTLKAQSCIRAAMKPQNIQERRPSGNLNYQSYPENQKREPVTQLR